MFWEEEIANPDTQTRESLAGLHEDQSSHMNGDQCALVVIG